MQKKQPIIITGLHRSGTSFLTRIMENNSVFFGESKDINQESLFFQNINKWIMSINSSTWDNPKSFIDKVDSNSYAMILNKIRILLKSRSNCRYFGFKTLFNKKDFFSLNYNWGWKDPRNVFTLPFWIDLFPKSKIIIIKRHPYDVSLSLLNRNIKLKKKDLLSIKKNIPYYLIPFLNLSNFSNLGSLRINNIDDTMKLYDLYILEINKLVNKYKANILLVKYEDVVLDSTRVLSEIYEFCNLNSSNVKLPEPISKDRAYAYKNVNMNFDLDKYTEKIKSYDY
ncbi:MAG: hypothetical protein CMG66_06350 [Candidatus Marinimicrobia bacterium]|nr:hypothetical protein [Candidatus Neomarinimicrobiota bacterium]|tara:strand:+ start:21212 stop:22060 length:849 start_codon:yes stop_codon:yes gene_type:complete